jgi:hypothetical protein
MVVGVLLGTIGKDVGGIGIGIGIGVLLVCILLKKNVFI